jgi:hypothetical protein
MVAASCDWPARSMDQRRKSFDGDAQFPVDFRTGSRNRV